MRYFNVALMVIAIGLCLAVNGLVPVPGHAEGYSFKVYNSTDSAIKKMLVSEDGKTWGEFDVGGGIGAGKSTELEWDESTNNEACKQYVKAVFSDGSESTPTKFNFCEKGLALEF
jgi:hypothetical protein